ncbi:MAG: hypothetical protein ACHP8A_01550 [Terriglobales bacterium]|jgi:hypothetical protein|nr:hypothetical protein [Terriglobales bacterium]
MAPPEYTLTVQKLGCDEFLARAYSTTGATTVRHRKYPTWNDLESAIAPIVGGEDAAAPAHHRKRKSWCRGTSAPRVTQREHH